MVESEMKSNLVVHDPDTLFNTIDQQRREQAVIEANDAAHRQTATRRGAGSGAAAETKLQSNPADKHDGSQGAKITLVIVSSKVTSNGTTPKASKARREKVFMARATATPPSSSSSGSNPQAAPLSIPGAKPPGRPLRPPHLRLELVGIKPPQKRWLREPSLRSLRRLCGRINKCTFACRGKM